MSNFVQEAIETLTELKRMHQLNYELIEQLNITCQWIVDNNIKIPNEELIQALLGKSLSLIAEIQAEVPKILYYTKLTDEKKHLFRTDEDVPVPLPSIVLRGENED